MTGGGGVSGRCCFSKEAREGEVREEVTEGHRGLAVVFSFQHGPLRAKMWSMSEFEERGETQLDVAEKRADKSLTWENEEEFPSRL